MHLTILFHSYSLSFNKYQINNQKISNCLGQTICNCQCLITFDLSKCNGIWFHLCVSWSSLVAQFNKESACNAGDHLQCRRPGFDSLGQEDPLEEKIATHSSILAWRIPWTEEPGGLQSMRLQRDGHNWVTNTFHAFLTVPLSYFAMYRQANTTKCNLCPIPSFYIKSSMYQLWLVQSFTIWFIPTLFSFNNYLVGILLTVSGVTSLFF